MAKTVKKWNNLARTKKDSLMISNRYQMTITAEIIYQILLTFQ